MPCAAANDTSIARIVAGVGAGEVAWREALAGWEIPKDILAQAPQTPWGFPPGRFAPPPDPVDSVARRLALALLPERGTVLDVGCGAGSASLALVPKASSIVGVDERQTMLDEFIRYTRERNVESSVVLGAWPGVASSIDAVDVVVCHHVLYNVAEVVPFVRALIDRARVGVVVEVTDKHPLTFLRPLWKHFWNLERPEGPSARDLVAMLVEGGLAPSSFDVDVRPPQPWGSPAEEAAFVRGRLCLAANRDHEVAAVLARMAKGPQELAVMTWRGTYA